MTDDESCAIKHMIGCLKKSDPDNASTSPKSSIMFNSDQTQVDQKKDPDDQKKDPI